MIQPRRRIFQFYQPLLALCTYQLLLKQICKLWLIHTSEPNVHSIVEKISRSGDVTLVGYTAPADMDRSVMNPNEVVQAMTAGSLKLVTYKRPFRPICPARALMIARALFDEDLPAHDMRDFNCVVLMHKIFVNAVCICKPNIQQSMSKIIKHQIVGKREKVDVAAEGKASTHNRPSGHLIVARHISWLHGFTS